MRRVWIHLFGLAALFTGLCLFLLTQDSVSWMDVLVTLLIGGGIYALALFFPVVRYVRAMPGSMGCGTLVAMALMGSIGTVIAVVALGMLQYPRGDWQQMPAPPERAVEIVDSAVYMVFGDEVWIRAESGGIYSLGCGNNLSCKWEAQREIPEAPEQAGGHCSNPGEARYQPPVKIGRTIDEQVTHFCGADYSVETHFRLMEDGTLWRWGTFSGMGSLFVSLLMIVAGSALSLVVPVLYGVARRVQLSGRRPEVINEISDSEVG